MTTLRLETSVDRQDPDDVEPSVFVSVNVLTPDGLQRHASVSLPAPASNAALANSLISCILGVAGVANLELQAIVYDRIVWPIDE